MPPKKAAGSKERKPRKSAKAAAGPVAQPNPRVCEAAVAPAEAGDPAGDSAPMRPCFPILPANSGREMAFCSTALKIDSEGSWPRSTDIHCWWCTEAFSCMPCSIPVSRTNGVFQCKGVFCSWECAKAFLIKDPMYSCVDRGGWLLLLAKRVCGPQVTGITAAPPRQALKKFGGSLTIEQFRGQAPRPAASGAVPMAMAPLPVQASVGVTSVANLTFEPQQATQGDTIPRSIVDHAELRLKRDQPLQGRKHSLLKYMAIKSVPQGAKR